MSALSVGPVSLAAVDIGASSGRVMLGHVGPDELTLTEVHRFGNGPVHLPGGLYWDALALYRETLTGVREALRRDDAVAGLAIDTWAVDYGLLDGDGVLLGNPHCYRDSRTERAVREVHALIDPAELYAVNGLQFLPFNTLYQFASEPSLPAGTRALLMPDLLGYWLTGVQVTEETNASTTGLLDATSGEISDRLFDVLDLPADLLPELVPAGSVVGALSTGVREQLGAGHDLRLTTVGSHDTASAVVGVPAASPAFGYVSLGTWGLVGVELDAPVLSEDGRAANFTNERGVDGTIRYLKNVMGLWLLSESVRTWRLHGLDVDLDDVLRAAAALPDSGARFDVNDPGFMPPGDMPARIVRACRDRGQPVGDSLPEIVRCILSSLAEALARAIEQAQELSGRELEVVHVVGGGSRNELLCRLIADAVRVPVIAGPVEATALGNLVVQARTHGALHGDLWALRARIRAVTEPRTFRPGGKGCAR